MAVRIKIPRELRGKTQGNKQVEVSGRNVKECLHELVTEYPGLKGEILDGRGTLLLKWVLAINGQTMVEDLSHPLKDGDIISLVPVISGGWSSRHPAQP